MRLAMVGSYSPPLTSTASNPSPIDAYASSTSSSSMSSLARFGITQRWLPGQVHELKPNGRQPDFTRVGFLDRLVMQYHPSWGV
jgi:hypothetical protein